MKTEHLVTNNDPIWANNVEFLSPEEGLPVIGSCQISSILQNLDGTNNESHPQNTDLIILNGSDYKMPLVETPLNLHNNYIILKDSISSDTCNKHLQSAKHSEEDAFEDMLYFVCNLCPFLCTKDTTITEHLEMAHKNKTINKLVELKCPACSNNFYHRTSLKSHLLYDHCVSNSDLHLIVEAVMYYSNKENKKHFKNQKITIRNSESLESPKASTKSIEHNGNSERSNCYQAQLSKEVPHNCTSSQKVTLPQVNITSSNSEKLFTDMMKKTGLSPKPSSAKKCLIPLCKVRLNDVTKLNYHIGCHTHSGFKCLECNEKFMMWKPLSSHLWRLHKIDMELYACDKCDYKTYSLSKLNNVHKLIHGDVKAFLCNICNKAFKNLKQLRNHKAVHKDKLDKVGLKCEACPKSFSDKRTLKSHIDIVHRKIKPYLCSYCGYKGSSRASLKMHVRLHTGEKPFSCNLCSYTTADHNSLRRHKLRHTGQKPYKCVYCPYACIQSSTYKIHLKTKHPGMEKDLMFTCNLCQFRTVNKELYNAHLVTTHRQKTSSE